MQKVESDCWRSVRPTCLRLVGWKGTWQDQDFLNSVELQKEEGSGTKRIR